MSRRAGSIVALLGAGGLLAPSCREPTSIVIEARTNVRPAEVNGTTFAVGAPSLGDDVLRVAETRGVDPDGVIGTLVVIPETSDHAAVSIKLVLGVTASATSCTAANNYKGCVVARRTIRYTPHERLQLPIFLAAECANVACTATSTCVAGVCVSSETVCEGVACAEPGAPPDGGGVTSIDGSAGDAGIDATRELRDAIAADGPIMVTLPGEVACSPGPVCKPPGATCCYDFGSLKGQCTVTGGCPVTTTAVKCDGPEDCANGAVCCAAADAFRCAVDCPQGSEICGGSGKCLKSTQKCGTSYKGTLYQFCQ